MKVQYLRHIRRSALKSEAITLLLMFALFSQSILPSLGIAIPGYSAEGQYTTTLCLQSGVITVTIDAQGKVLDELSNQNSSQHCPYCIFFGHSLTSIPAYTLFPAMIQAKDSYELGFVEENPASPTPFERYLTRAPPARV